MLLISFVFNASGQIKQYTTFIYKDSLLGSSQSIYFDTNKNSWLYNEISHFKFLQFDKESYKLSTDYLKEKNLTLVKKPSVIPIKKWVTLKQYKNTFYAYYPCDFLFHYRVSINDSTFIDWTGEGPVASKIIQQKKIDAKTYQFKLSGIYDHNRTLTIHIIDQQKGIAIFEENNIGEATQYGLMIAADKIKTVPLIVNNCETQKQTELTFDEPDYAQWLKSH